MNRYALLVSLTALGVVSLAGCRTNCNTRSPCDDQPRAPWPGTDGPRAPFPPGPPNAAPGTMHIPPPPAPAPGFPQTSNTNPNPAASVAQSWQPGGSVRIQLGPPQVSEDRPSETTRFYSPPPAITDGPANVPASTTKLAPTALPVGIPQFAIAKENVACGLRPLLEDGLDWLEANKYRAVLHLRPPGEEDNADRKQVEKRGLKYLSLEVSPQNLQTVIDEFNRIVGEVGNYPLFVYDRDGSLAGSLWYAHFRTTEKVSDEAARVRAGSLGLREDRSGGHREMWQAVQQLLSNQ